ncbi:MAG TPA: flagellin [Acetobacteraceae bacterium]|nr:flagellin [Acetobacteraceae bacterium]
MSMGVLNNIAATYAANNLSNTQASLQNVLTQLSSGSRINSGADDAAGLSLANGLQANQTALTQSASNVSLGVGLLQTADGALSQVNNLLNRAVTLATEAGNGTLNGSQDAAANQEYQSILAEINNIGAATTYNGNAVFGAAGGVSIYTSDGTTAGTSTDTLTIAALSSAKVGDSGGTIASGAGNTISYTVGTSVDLSATDLTSSANAQTALTAIGKAINAVAGQRGYLGSQINTLNSMASVETTQSENLASASNSIMATDYTQATSELSKYQILTQTGISALAQANSTQQAVTKLLQ